MEPTPRKAVVYVAGPYSGPSYDPNSYYDVNKNIMFAREFAKRIWEAGAACFCPHANTIHFQVDCKCSYQDYIDGDLAILSRCDALFMLPTWQYSKGAKIERDFASEKKLPIFYDFENLKLWIDGFNSRPEPKTCHSQSANPAAQNQAMPTGQGTFIDPLVADDVKKHRVTAKGIAQVYYQLMQAAFYLKLRLLGGEADTAAIRQAVLDDLEARAVEGEKKYGTRLRTNNGRSMAMDAYQECLDFLKYCRGDIEEIADITKQISERNVHGL